MTGLFDQYVVVDQVTGQHWAFEIIEGELYWVSTSLPSNGDAILQDGSTYWNLGVSNGVIQWSVTSRPADGGDLVYLIDASSGLDYQILIIDGELYWIVATPELGGSSGPINPYDYINIFTEEHFLRKVVVKGDKAYLVGIELGFEGSKSFYDGTSLDVGGTKRLSFKESKACRGDKQYSFREQRNIAGDKSLREARVVELGGTKLWNINETRKIKGKRDITNILEALDLI